MFWDMMKPTPSNLNRLVEDEIEEGKLERLINEFNFLQEVKAHPGLQQFLSDSIQLEKIVNYALVGYNEVDSELLALMATVPGDNEDDKLTLPKCSEICYQLLTMEVWTLTQSILNSSVLIDLILTLVPFKDDVEDGSGFRYLTVLTQLLDHRPALLIDRLRKVWPKLLNGLVKHLWDASMAEVIIRLYLFLDAEDDSSEIVSSEADKPEYLTNILVTKLMEGNEIERYHSEMILVELIQHYNHQMLTIRSKSLSLCHALVTNNFPILLSSLTPSTSPSIILAILSITKALVQIRYHSKYSDHDQVLEFHQLLLIELGKNLEGLVELVKGEQFIPKEMENSVGKFIPLGKFRYDVIGFMVEVFRCLINYQLMAQHRNNQPDEEPVNLGECKPSAEIIDAIFIKLVELGYIGWMLDLYLAFPYNDMLHYDIYKFLHQLLLAGQTIQSQTFLYTLTYLVEEYKIGEKLLETNKLKDEPKGRLYQLAALIDQIISNSNTPNQPKVSITHLSLLLSEQGWDKIKEDIILPEQKIREGKDKNSLFDTQLAMSLTLGYDDLARDDGFDDDEDDEVLEGFEFSEDNLEGQDRLELEDDDLDLLLSQPDDRHFDQDDDDWLHSNPAQTLEDPFDGALLNRSYKVDDLSQINDMQFMNNLNEVSVLADKVDQIEL